MTAPSGPRPLIAQIGKNDLPPDAAPFAGRELVALAEDRLRAVMREVGGRAALSLLLLLLAPPPPFR